MPWCSLLFWEHHVLLGQPQWGAVPQPFISTQSFFNKGCCYLSTLWFFFLTFGVSNLTGKRPPLLEGRRVVVPRGGKSHQRGDQMRTFSPQFLQAR